MDEKNIEDFGFEEEFDKTKVANKDIIKKDKNNLEEKNELDVDSLMNYDEELRKKNAFREEYTQDGKDTATEEEKLRELFNDFLILPRISGAKIVSHENRIPKEKVQLRGRNIQIDAEPSKDSDKQQNTTVLINRNDNGDIESIEVNCSCGERTLIKLDYSDTQKTENTEQGKNEEENRAESNPQNDNAGDKEN